jgi:hypothetical protein
LLVSTFPAVLGATNKGVDVPLPNMTLLAVRVDKPVPPDDTPRVPASVTAPVVDVLGVKPLKDVSKDVTEVDTEDHVGAPPVLAVKTCPLVPFVRYAVVPAED